MIIQSKPARGIAVLCLRRWWPWLVLPRWRRLVLPRPQRPVFPRPQRLSLRGLKRMLWSACAIRSTCAYRGGDIERKMNPSAPENLPLIREVCRARGNEADWRRYICPPELTATYTYTANWWWKATKERHDVLSPDDGGEASEPIESVVYDGNVVRSLNRGAKPPIGLIRTPADGNWEHLRKEHPSSFWHYGTTPMSRLLAERKGFSIQATNVGGGNGVRISVLQPGTEKQWIVFMFDQEGNLRERQLVWKSGKHPEPWMYCKEEFGHYREHKEPSGETISFPHRKLVHNYMGVTADGKPVEWMQEVYQIREVRFNHEIPDDIFQIPFPPGTRVLDTAKPDAGAR